MGNHSGFFRIGTTMQKDRILIYSPDCLSCSHLVDVEGCKLKKHKDCYFENGNDRCPAQYITILKSINFEKASTDLADALKTGNTKKINKLYEKLSKYDLLIQQRVKDMADTKR